MMSCTVTPVFEQFATSYDAATPIQSQVAEHLAQLIMRYYTGVTDMCVVDVGCGTGKLTEAVMSKFLQNAALASAQLYGVDTAASMLTIWQQRVAHLLSMPLSSTPVSSLPTSPMMLHSQALCANMTNMALANQSADLVMSSFALHWTSPSVIAELGRIVKTKGQLHLAIPVAGSFHEVRQRFPKLPVFDFLPSHAWLAAIETLRQQRQGTLMYHTEQSFAASYDNLKSLLKNLKQMGGAVSGKDRIDTAVFRRYLQDPSPIGLDYELLMIGLQL
ncbi:methyltransferase domain-containing protein [Moraxella osloensis]|uniref:methyltransferase domain-containing protein n=1 Tax=Faucicola osloensis TaxID=34062 RepID=UPI002006CF81|nr:methyltransferase domain-containing protein [Moraxella osloensis]MCK6052317.1 methyltransferase domain-containing protein [Moraxella osloensis]